MKKLRLLLTILAIQICLHQARGQEAIEVRRYQVPQSRQGVAVNEQYFFVINNSSITKHSKSDGKLLKSWNGDTAIIKHLNSGIILDGKLYCTNSNYPESPMASSIEIFDPETLQHIDNHSFGINIGSATWIDRYQGYWYVAFAHYTGRGASGNKSNAWTQLVQFDKEWRQISSWIFPPNLIQRFGTRSNSGGVIDDDGSIYCTGHDHKELYKLEFPEMGYSLKWIKTIPLANEGQGIALDDFGNEKLIYGIIKREKVVTISRIDPFLVN